jgi:hypothetical protein
MLIVMFVVGMLAGLMLGWYARTIRDLLTVVMTNINQQREAVAEKRSDRSAVIIGNQVHRRGQTVQLPEYTGAIVKARTPEQVKKDKDLQWAQELQELKEIQQ